MVTPSVKPGPIEVTQIMVRLYTLLSQAMDRAVNEANRESFAEADFQAQLKTTQAETLAILSTNRVVHDKVQKQCERALALAAAAQQPDPAARTAAIEKLHAERAMLHDRTIAMTDLLAVFRST